MLVAPVALLCALVVGSVQPLSSYAQQPARTFDSSHALTRAVSAVCAERATDPLRSAAIDEMQARPSMPTRHPEAVAGMERARRLLALARTLTQDALGNLAREYGWQQPEILERARTRITAVRRIEPDMELRDNAAVYHDEPRVVRFGTLFLAGLPSDEAMIGVIAHELTHVADGNDNILRPLFLLVARRAATLTMLPRTGARRAEELGCDLAGAMVTRSLIARASSVDPPARRAARALQHNCVMEDTTDSSHLSPRQTMRAVLALLPALARILETDEGASRLPLSPYGLFNTSLGASSP